MPSEQMIQMYREKGQRNQVHIARIQNKFKTDERVNMARENALKLRGPEAQYSFDDGILMGYVMALQDNDLLGKGPDAE